MMLLGKSSRFSSAYRYYCNKWAARKLIVLDDQAEAIANHLRWYRYTCNLKVYDDDASARGYIVHSLILQ